MIQPAGSGSRLQAVSRGTAEPAISSTDSVSRSRPSVSRIAVATLNPANRAVITSAVQRPWPASDENAR